MIDTAELNEIRKLREMVEQTMSVPTETHTTTDAADVELTDAFATEWAESETIAWDEHRRLLDESIRRYGDIWQRLADS